MTMEPVATRGPGRNEILRDGLLGGIEAGELAARFNTPFHVYDLDVVTDQVEALRACLPAGFELAYATKANPNLAILRHLAALGLGADVASGGELRHVLRAGFTADRVVFTGPGKRDEELQLAVDAGVSVVTVESRGELRRLAAIAESLGRVQPILLRRAVLAGSDDVSPLDGGQPIGSEIGGKFGMDDADLSIAAGEAVRSAWLEPLGLHAFGASNVRDADQLARHVEASVEAAISLAAGAGFDLRLVDVGGGLGIPYGDGDDPLDLGAFGSRLHSLATRLGADPVTRGLRVLMEPGRFLVGAAGAYVARVVDCKSIDGRQVAILDGGIHHLLRPVLVGQEQRLRFLTGRAAGERQVSPTGAASAPAGVAAPRSIQVCVAGPLCSGLDVLARTVVGSPPEPGDLVAVLDSGAYGATESMPFFLSHPLPPEIVLRGGEAWVSRPRVDPDTWLGWQV